MLSLWSINVRGSLYISIYRIDVKVYLLAFNTSHFSFIPRTYRWISTHVLPTYNTRTYIVHRTHTVGDVGTEKGDPGDMKTRNPQLPLSSNQRSGQTSP